jgi:hypothetical protein
MITEWRQANSDKSPMQYSPTYMLPQSTHNQTLLQYCTRIVQGVAFLLNFIAIMVAFAGKICDGNGCVASLMSNRLANHNPLFLLVSLAGAVLLLLLLSVGSAGWSYHRKSQLLPLGLRDREVALTNSSARRLGCVKIHQQGTASGWCQNGERST